MNVTRNRTAMNGYFNSFMASSQANEFSPDTIFLGGVCGSVRLKPARIKEAIPATIKAQLLPWLSAAPVSGVPNADPSHGTNPPAASNDGTLAQSVRMKMNGQLAAI